MPVRAQAKGVVAVVSDLDSAVGEQSQKAAPEAVTRRPGTAPVSMIGAAPVLKSVSAQGKAAQR
jgi:hypothetical protein